MRMLVCGSRNWTDRWIVQTLVWGAAVSGQEDPVDVIIEGEAPGADQLARWAAGQYDDIDTDSYPADWDRYGKRAGYVRNQQMLDEGKPDVVVAFRSPGESKGTDMMCDVARKAGIPVYVVTGGQGDDGAE